VADVVAATDLAHGLAPFATLERLALLMRGQFRLSAHLHAARDGTGAAFLAMTIVAPYVIHRHRRLWERPDEFDPNRFLGENRMRVNRYAYLPFGAGPRICLGATFALQQATILLASIAARFTLELAPGIEVEPLLRITLRPRGGFAARHKPAKHCSIGR
jgi:hypothetical protein